MILRCASSLASLSSCSSLSDVQEFSFRTWTHRIGTVRCLCSFTKSCTCNGYFGYPPCQRDGVRRPTAGSASCSPPDCAQHMALTSGPPYYWDPPLDHIHPKKHNKHMFTRRNVCFWVQTVFLAWPDKQLQLIMPPYLH